MEKTPSDLDETQSNKQKLSLPTVLLQDKSFCSAVPESSLLAEPHAGPLLIPAELWQVFSSFLAAPALLVLRTSWELGALPSKAIPYFGKDRALSIQWDAPEQETLARTPQPHKPLQPNTCNQQSNVPQLSHHPSQPRSHLGVTYQPYPCGHPHSSLLYLTCLAVSAQGWGQGGRHPT